MKDTFLLDSAEIYLKRIASIEGWRAGIDSAIAYGQLRMDIYPSALRIGTAHRLLRIATAYGALGSISQNRGAIVFRFPTTW